MDRYLPMVEQYILRGAVDFAMIGIYTRRFGDCSYFALCSMLSLGLLRQSGCGPLYLVTGPQRR